MKPHLTIAKISAFTCPFCGAEAELAVKASDRSIAPGSMLICGTCREISVVGSKLEFRKPTTEELAKVNLIALQRDTRSAGTFSVNE